MEFIKNISVAHSPDADDIFMYEAINLGWVDTKNLSFKAKADDIQTLNVATINGVYDACAISFGLYPFVCDDFVLLDTAVSFGNGYGPKLIKRKNESLKRNFKVALSGEHTSNALLFRIAYPQARITYMNFLDIENAVLKGVVDAGVLIHESILDFSDELEVECEIWDIWAKLSGGALPLPLGGMALRRSLPLGDACNVQNILKKAVKVARERKAELSKILIEKNLVRVDDVKLAKYLELYANDESVEMSEVQLDALDKFFELGYTHGLYPRLIKARDNLIPKEYEELRKN